MKSVKAFGLSAAVLAAAVLLVPETASAQRGGFRGGAVGFRGGAVGFRGGAVGFRGGAVGFRGAGFAGRGWGWRGRGWGWGAPAIGLGVLAGAALAGSYYGYGYGYGPYYGYDYPAYYGVDTCYLTRTWGPYGPVLVRVCD